MIPKAFKKLLLGTEALCAVSAPLDVETVARALHIPAESFKSRGRVYAEAPDARVGDVAVSCLLTGETPLTLWCNDERLDLESITPALESAFGPVVYTPSRTRPEKGGAVGYAGTFTRRTVAFCFDAIGSQKRLTAIIIDPSKHWQYKSKETLHSSPALFDAAPLTLAVSRLCEGRLTVATVSAAFDISPNAFQKTGSVYDAFDDLKFNSLDIGFALKKNNLLIRLADQRLELNVIKPALKRQFGPPVYVHSQSHAKPRGAVTYEVKNKTIAFCFETYKRRRYLDGIIING